MNFVSPVLLLVKVKNSSQKILLADSFRHVSGQSFGWLLADSQWCVGNLSVTCWSGSTDDSNNIEGSMNTVFIPELDHEHFVLQQQQ